MKISICVPVYNVADYVRECLDSIVESLRQYGGDVVHELIIVDDASTDGSNLVCKEYAARLPSVSLYKHDRNKGLAEARNTLLSKASGDYIAWVDSDDCVARNWFSVIADNIEIDQPDVFAFELTRFDGCSECETHFGEKSFGIKREGTCNIVPIDYALKVLQGLTILDYSCTRVVKRSLHEGLTYRAPRRIYEDTVFAFDFLDRIRTVRYYAGSLYRYRQRDSSIMHARTAEDYIREINYLMQTVVNMEQPFRDAATVHVMSDMRRVMVAAAKASSNSAYVAVAKEYRRFFRKHLFAVLSDRRIPIKRKLADLLTVLPGSQMFMACKKS